MIIGFIVIVLTILSAVGVGWSIGANDAANSLGTAVGSRVLTLRQAIIQICIFGFLGAMLQGHYVTATIGNGIVPLNALPGQQPTAIALVSCLAACGWIIIATYFKMPISTSHSIVGAVAGAGLAVHATVQWSVLGGIFVCWMFTPLGAALLGYVVYRLIGPFFDHVLPPRLSQPLLKVLIVVSGWYVAFSWGANDVANAVGVLTGAKILNPTISLFLGGAAILFGILTWGSRVIETIGTNITNLLPVMAFSAQIASALNVHLYTLLGVPVSTSHSIVGAIFGVGIVRGLKVVNLTIIREIITCWLATPFVSGLISFVLLKGLLMLAILN